MLNHQGKNSVRYPCPGSLAAMPWKSDGVSGDAIQLTRRLTHTPTPIGIDILAAKHER